MNKDNLVFIHKFLRAIADSIIAVFIPLYIVQQTGNMAFALIYLAVTYFLAALFNILLRKLIEKHTLFCLLIYFIPTIILQSLFAFFEITIYLVLICATLAAINNALYNVPFNLVFTQSSKKTNVARFENGNLIGGLAFTLLSGILLDKIEGSFLILSIISSVLYITSSIPLFISYKSKKGNDEEKIPQNKRVEIKNDEKNFMIYHILFGIFQSIVDHIVPLYIYQEALSFTSVTIIIVGIRILRIFINALAQYLAKNKKNKIAIILGSSISFVSLLIMVIFRTPIMTYIACTLISLSYPFTFVVIFRMYCIYIKKENVTLDSMVNRDIFIFSGRPLIYLVGITPIGLLATIFGGLLINPLMLFYSLRIEKKYGKLE